MIDLGLLFRQFVEFCKRDAPPGGKGAEDLAGRN